jgi:BirA family biotin operon repressor/biotin-[acetyl-CoA-carboxylase] ligase
LWVKRPEAPNGWGKLAGILIETALPTGMSYGSDQGRYCVVGVGINIAAPVAEGLSTAPLGLQDLQSDITAPDALMKVAEPLLTTLLAFERMGFAPLQNAFNARDALRDLNVTLSNGRHGVARGVDVNGAMLVDTEQGQEAISSSEVSVRPA